MIETRVRVMTWNLWWRFGDWEARQAAIAATLRRADPDIACLQEVWEVKGGESQASILASELGGYHHAYAPAAEAAEDGGVSLGNAVVSRWPITEAETRRLPTIEGHEELRVVLRAAIDGPRGPLDVYVTHLNYRLDESAVRQLQVRALVEFVAEIEGRTFPAVICGDLNADPSCDEIRMLTGRTAVPVPRHVFFDAWDAVGEGPGFTESPSTNPLVEAVWALHRRIDYVLVGWPKDEGVGLPYAAWLEGVDPVDGVQPSDHYGVVAELRY